MKIFALCALFAAAAAASICEQEGSDPENLLGSTAIGMGIVINNMMEGCYPEGDTFSALIFGNTHCKKIFDEGFCYGNVGKSKYEDHDSKSVTWEMVVSGIPNAEAFGNVLCANTELCYTPVKEALLECYEDPEFVADVKERAETFFAYAKGASSTYSAANQGTMASSLINMVLKRFSSLDDVMSSYEENEDDITDAYETILSTASTFCSSGCVGHTASYLTPFLTAIQDQKCSKVNKFCGKCKHNAQAYVNGNMMPCCVTDVIDAALESIDAMKEAHAAEIETYTAEIETTVNEKEKKKAGKAYKEILCLRAMYEGRLPKGCMNYS